MYGGTWKERQQNALDMTNKTAKFFKDLSKIVYSHDNTDNPAAYFLSKRLNNIGKGFDQLGKYIVKPN